MVPVTENVSEYPASTYEAEPVSPDAATGFNLKPSVFAARKLTPRDPVLLALADQK